MEEEIVPTEFKIEIWEDDDYRIEHYTVWSDDGWDTENGAEILEAFTGEHYVEDEALLRIHIGNDEWVAKYHEDYDSTSMTINHTTA